MLSEKQAKRLAQYEKDLAIPAWKYVLIYGFSFSFLYVLFSFSYEYFKGNTNIKELIISKALIYFIIFSGGTILYGIIMRLLVYLQYKKLKSKIAAK